MVPRQVVFAIRCCGLCGPSIQSRSDALSAMVKSAAPMYMPNIKEKMLGTHPRL